MNWRSLFQSAERILPRYYAVMLIAAVILYGFTPQIELVDMGWHLRQGEWMVQNHTVLREDIFNFPNLHRPFVSEYVIYQLFYWTIQHGSEVLVGAVASFLIALLFLLPWSLNRKIHFSGALLGIAFFLSYIMGLPRDNFRPELFTSLGLVFFSVFLLRHYKETNWKAYWPLALAMFIWVNCHSGFILGLLLLGLFGAEMIARAGLKYKKFPVKETTLWLKVIAFVAAACLVNPYGFKRIALPFYHQGSGVIRAYVTEMQPMDFNLGDMFVVCMLLQLAVVALAIFLYRGGFSWSYLLLLLAIFYGTFQSQRHIGLFSIFAPCMILSCGVFGKPRQWLKGNWGRGVSVAIYIVFVVLAFLFAMVQFTTDGPLNIRQRWAAYKVDSAEFDACANWMRSHNLGGKILSRTEIGSWIQMEHLGLTYADTGFGKFTEDFIHEIGLATERPDYLPWLIKKYNPDCVMVAAQGYNWPGTLSKIGWRCVYYSPNRSLWVAPNARPDLPTASQNQIAAAYSSCMQNNSECYHGNYLYWPLLKIHYMGLSRLATDTLLALPPESKGTVLFWECVDMLCFGFKPMPDDCLEDIHKFAQQPENEGWNFLFTVRYLDLKGKSQEAIDLMEKVPQTNLNDPIFTLLAKDYLKTGQWDKAFALLKKRRLFYVRNGDRYAMLARCKEHFSHAPSAASSWKKALFFFPDDASFRDDVAQFLKNHPDPQLTGSLQEIERGK